MSRKRTPEQLVAQAQLLAQAAEYAERDRLDREMALEEARRLIDALLPVIDLRALVERVEELERIVKLKDLNEES